ncbi:hypothetical protein CK203_107514 [Vitis vinifera]|uniref:Uncharacterized protein n=1 Tax=Vitis vinifera TaxID=29760 RepID=A0A438CSP1_VITVI|nr:hypothetical protein CK203_107514 [Vitis vinifera]
MGAHPTKNTIPGGKGRNCCEPRQYAERINSIRPGLTGEALAHRWDNHFPPVDPTRTLQPHRDALILSLGIGDFDVRRVLVDPGSSANLVQASVIGHMGHSLTGLENPDESYPDSTDLQHILRRHYTTGPSWPQSLSTCNSQWYKSYHPSMSSWTHMASLHESHPFHISSNGEFPHQRRTN